MLMMMQTSAGSPYQGVPSTFRSETREATCWKFDTEIVSYTSYTQSPNKKQLVRSIMELLGALRNSTLYRWIVLWYHHYLGKY
jgi:hypothetical protein